MKSTHEDEPFSQDRILRSLEAFPIDLLKIYPRSFCSKNGLSYGLIRTPQGKRLAVLGEKSHVVKDAFQGNCDHRSSSLKLCDLSMENTECLMDLFPYTKPVSLRNYPMTIGMGDRLGLAAPGHIRAIRKFEAHPVLAQPSIEEDEQTGRNLIDAIRDAAWAVFQENYQEGYGADGDHLKSIRDVKSALDAGVSMITLDVSERIDSDVLGQPTEWVDRRFKEEIDEGDAKVTFHLFLDKQFTWKGTEGEFSIRFDEEGVKRNALLFYKALDFTEEVYEWIRLHRKNQGSADFEISFSGVSFPTSLENHFFFALELSHRGVYIQSLGPRFAGEIRDGTDLKGDCETFRRQFYRHVLIAEDYGYKISVRSESDPSFLFRHLHQLSKGSFHLKTSGTSWLEAMRLIAIVHPLLYREIHSWALSEWARASRPDYVAADPYQIPKPEELSEGELPSLLDQEDCRQLLHITYGALLNAKNSFGEYLFRERLHQTLTRYEEDYWSMLDAQLEKYLIALGVKKREERAAGNNLQKKQFGNF